MSPQPALVVKTAGRFVTRPADTARGIARSLESSMRRASIILSRNVRKGLTARMRRHPFWGAIGGKDGLAVRTGRTRARLTQPGTIYHRGSMIVAAVGSPDEHVREAEEGGTFTRSGWFRIPTVFAQTPAGVDRYAGMSLRAIPNTFVRGIKGGGLWGFQRQPDGTVLPLYRYTHTVTRKGRHVFAKARKASEPDIVREVGRGVSIEVARANA